MSAIGTLATIKEGKGSSALSCSSDVDVISDGEGIIDFNAEIPNGPLDLVRGSARHVATNAFQIADAKP